MPQSLSNVVIHIIFSTKDRHPWLDAINGRPRMHTYLATSAATRARKPSASAVWRIISSW
jgi:hypothetical protein